ncbi:MAG: alpha-amylase [Cytophagales bacterium]
MQNGTMIQFFHWYSNEGLWNHAKNEADKLAKLGVNAAWLPPAFKGTDGGFSRGYNVYDIFDLGEFDQKGSVATRFGTKEEYLQCIKKLQSLDIQVYADIVLNHMGGADEKEMVTVRKVNPENRNEFISDPYQIEAYTKFTFPGRKGQYSDFIWDFHCFSGVDYDAKNDETAIFSIQNEYGDRFDDVMNNENGNFDYLMYSDIDYRNGAVRDQVKYWGKWYLETAQFDGVRLDAIKHIPPKIIAEWLDYMRSIKPELFAVGEYWSPGDLPAILKYIELTGGKLSLFDACLQHNLSEASKKGRDFNLSTIFNDTLVTANPYLAVTIVDNHDTQPLQMLEAPVENWFKPLSYALILLREAGYPCIFYPDLYGAKYTDKGKDGKDYEIVLPKCEKLEKLMMARKIFSYGIERDYFDHPNCIGWTREGEDDMEKSGCAVIMCNGDNGNKYMEIGKRHAGKTFVDYLQFTKDEVVINNDGWGDFKVPGGKVSVWVEK